MKTKIFIFLITLSAIVSSCEKEFSKEAGSLIPVLPATGDSTVLSKFIWLSSAAGVEDTMTVTTFTYDNLKRLSKEITVTYLNSIPNYTEDYFTTYYYYNSADTVPAKTMVVSLDSAGNNQLGVDSAVSFFTRNANQQIIKDSTYYIQFYRNPGPAQGTVYITTSDFIIYADSIIEHYKYADPFGLSVGTNKYAQTRINGNLSQEVFSILENTGYREIRRVTNTFDNKINPFAIRNVNYPVSLKNDFGVRDHIFKNNFTMEVYSESATTPPFLETVISTYTYNTLNYPKTVVQINPADPSQTLKGIYIYTK